MSGMDSVAGRAALECHPMRRPGCDGRDGCASARADGGGAAGTALTAIKLPANRLRTRSLLDPSLAHSKFFHKWPSLSPHSSSERAKTLVCFYRPIVPFICKHLRSRPILVCERALLVQPPSKHFCDPPQLLRAFLFPPEGPAHTALRDSNYFNTCKPLVPLIRASCISNESIYTGCPISACRLPPHLRWYQSLMLTTA